MKDEIRTHLQDIERQEQVRILYACESGSRAWGFASSDSDYDVRFTYLHPRDWYLSVNLEKKRDVIERPIVDALDITGWDLRKALQLFRKSNPPLLEWLGSPIVYLEKYDVIANIKQLASQYYSPTACAYHYLHMAQGNYRDYLKGPEVWLKKYFYILRPILAINWIEQGLGVVPMEFGVLVDHLITSPELKNAINKLLADKRQGKELDRGLRIAPISDFIDSELQRLDAKEIKYPKPSSPIEELNAIFREALNVVWQSE
ncbi:MAG: nucleotidyltransferase domain-containing protein [Chloroflexi bacterium]|nr:nucleotidyltransferase domain-containing protein [Chloroflexota bacterium]